MTRHRLLAPASARHAGLGGDDPLKFARLGAVGAERPLLIAYGRSYDLSGLTNDITGSFLADGGPEQATAALDARNLPEIERG